MFKSHPGELAALATAIFWTITALAFTAAGKRIGSLAVNFWRLIIGLVFLSSFLLIRGSEILPWQADSHALIWLSLSGLVGIFLGDLFLFKAFTLTGPRVALLVMSISPVFAAILSWAITGELLGISGFIGMAVTLTGIMIVIISRKDLSSSNNSKIVLNYDRKGILFALLGAIGQAAGLVMSKIGLQTMNDPFAATQIRIIAGIAGFLVLITLLRRWNSVFFSYRDGKSFSIVALGAFFGPFLGISFSLLAVKYTNPGIVQTIASLTPVLIIPFSIFFNKEIVRIRDLLGALIAIAGVSIFFLI
jgi:drug/metabolite transporter (DMT)-like permease